MPKGINKDGTNNGFKKGHKINIGRKFTLGKRWKVKNSSRMSKFKKGNTIWTGKKRTEEDKKNKSISALGRKLSVETKLKMSNSQKGRIAWNKGKTGYISTKKGKKYPHLQGKNSHLWKENKKGILNNFIRSSYKYRQWRSDVFTRDDFTCCKCSKRGCEIHPHHIKQLALILIENNIITIDMAIECEELWNINNGQTLCINCHKLTDSYAKRI
jgi:hypothetical protein